MASIWAPASQDSSQCWQCCWLLSLERGVRLLLCLPLPLPSLGRFFECPAGPVSDASLPLGAGRFMHLVVLYGYQGAVTDAEQLALTDQLFDAALGELSVVGRSWAALYDCWRLQRGAHQNPLPGKRDFGWALAASWALAAGLRPAPTCKRDWDTSGGHRRGLCGWLPPCCCRCSFLWCSA